jgi:TRAP-type mannitol/chloroaromatic compound transport system substrate-binding protein
MVRSRSLSLAMAVAGLSISLQGVAQVQTPTPAATTTPAPTPAPATTPAAAPAPAQAPAVQAPAQTQGQVQPDRQVRLTVQGAFPRSIFISGTSAIALVEKIRKVSGGSIDARFTDPGSIVPPFQMLEAIQSGALDAAWSVGGYWGGKDATFNLFSAVPFGPDNVEFIAWMYSGGGLEMMRELYANYGAVAIPCGMTPPEAGGWFRKEIKTVDDLKGLKMRFYGIGSNALAKLGVVPQNIPGGDIYSALERGTIDATEFSTPSIDVTLGLHKVAKFYYFPGWHQQATFLELLISKKKWDEMSATQKSLIELSCGDSVRDTIAQGEGAQFKALADLQANGVQFRRFPKPVLDALEKAWREVVAEESAKNPRFKTVNEQFTKFRENYAVWRQMSSLK